MSNPTHIDTGGGTYVGGDVQTARDFVGRDQFNISVHLQDVNDAAQVTRAIAAALSKSDLESESIRAEFLSLMEELRKTHSTIVKTISPLRRVQDNANTFASDFEAVYNDFRDFYDAYDFWEERTRCHKIRQIGERLEKHRSPITQTPEWVQLRRNLDGLYQGDTDLIDAYYRPFMTRFNDVMAKIHQHVVQQEIGEAITLKRVFLDELTPQYDGIKQMLGLMTNTIANIELSLG
jgi:hypothetical protein